MRIASNVLRSLGLVLWGSLIVVHLAHGDRLAYVEGKFYPKSPDALKEEIGQLLHAADLPKIKDTVFALIIVPHAGYAFSGSIAAQAYARLPQNFDTIILIGPQHAGSINKAVVFPSGDWQTPLGKVKLDETFIQLLKKGSSHLVFDPAPHEEEHSLEVQLPFLQITQPQAKVVPVVINDVNFSWALANALLKAMLQAEGKRFLVVISTDMSHYLKNEQAHLLDEETIALIEASDRCSLKRALQQKSRLCGSAAVLTGLALLDRIPQVTLTRLVYKTSGDITGNTEGGVVGYSAFLAQSNALFSEAIKEDIVDLSESQKKGLLRLARKSLTHFLQTGTYLDIQTTDPNFQRKKAVFVTLYKKGRHLRGCIGRTSPEEPLGLAVQHMAIEAGTEDSRFPRVTLDEVKDLTFEISILTKPVPVCDVNEIPSKTYGVTVARDGQHGIFLPEVWESLNTEETFFGELCQQKAHLERRCWQDPQTKFKVFTSVHFGEESLN